MAQIVQSGVITLGVIQVNNHVTEKINKGFNSAEYALFDVALHVRFGVDHIKNICIQFLKMYLFLRVNIDYLQATVSKLFSNTTMEPMII